VDSLPVRVSDGARSGCSWRAVPLLGGLLALPAPGADEKADPKQLKVAETNLKDIGIAHHAFYDTDENCPTTSRTRTGDCF